MFNFFFKHWTDIYVYRILSSVIEPTYIYIYSLLNSFFSHWTYIYICIYCWILFFFSHWTNIYLYSLLNYVGILLECYLHSVESIFFFIMTINRFQIISFTIEIHIYLKIIFPHRNQHSQLKCQCLYIPVSYGRCLQCYRKQLLICNITFNLNDGKVLCNFWTFNWYIVCTNVNIEVYPIEHKSRK